MAVHAFQILAIIGLIIAIVSPIVIKISDRREKRQHPSVEHK